MLLALVTPGWAARRRHRALAIGLFAGGVVGPALLVGYTAVTDRNRVALGLDRGFLAVAVVVGVIAIVARIIAMVEVWDAAGRPRSLERLESVALVGAVVALVVSGLFVAQMGRSRAALVPAFGAVGDDALFDAAAAVPAARADAGPIVTAPRTPTTDSAESSSVPEKHPSPIPGAASPVVSSPFRTTTTTLPPLPERPDSGVPADELTDVSTVLLLGGDAGPGRSGLRTDTMMLFSLHEPSGRASLVSLPRDLRGLLFPPGSALEDLHPYGFDDRANAVYPVVSSRPALRASYEIEGVRPGVVAIAQAIGYSLDVTIDDYVLVDMAGFIDLVDALGGVTVDVRKEIPMPGNVPGASTQYPDTIGPGTIAMDGTTALGYVRSRYADSDFQRTARQRRLLAALAQQVSFTEVVLSFPSVASAVGGTLRTSLDPDELTTVLEVIGGETAIVESVGLVPPLVRVDRPDFDAMAKVVGEVHRAIVTGRPSGY